MPKALKRCPKSNKSPDLVTLISREKLHQPAVTFFGVEKYAVTMSSHILWDRVLKKIMFRDILRYTMFEQSDWFENFRAANQNTAK